MAQLAAIFVAIGAGFGLLRGDGLVFGAVAGALLFGLMIGVGSLCELIGRGRR
jgi:hypothetical protein